MTGWHRGPMVAFDFEATAADPTEARPVSCCVAVIGRDPQPEVTSWLINPGVPIPAESTAIHGITDEHVQAGGASAEVAVLKIVAALSLAWQNGWPVVGQNVGYDLTLLDHELARHGSPGLSHYGGPGLVIDTLCLDRWLDRYRKGKRTLTRLCEVYNVRLDGAHDATFDALASARVAWRMAEKYPDKLQVPLDVLHEQQRNAHADWAANFQEYLRKKDPTAVINDAWPYQPANAKAAAA